MSEQKGQMYGKCNRTACDERGHDVTWWNPHTAAFYCTCCARKINPHLKGLAPIINKRPADQLVTN